MATAAQILAFEVAPLIAVEKFDLHWHLCIVDSPKMFGDRFGI